MERTGQIRKMKTSYDTVVHYTLPIGGEEVYMNELVGKNMRSLWRKNTKIVPARLLLHLLSRLARNLRVYHQSRIVRRPLGAW
jgi:hypothetical protein